MKKFLISALMLAAATPAMAFDVNQGNFYISAEGGTTEQGGGEPWGLIWGHSDGHWGAALHGGYQLPVNQNVNLGLELGYLHLGSTVNTSTGCFGNACFTDTYSTKQRGGDLLAVATYNFANGLNIFGKAGGAYVKQTVDYNGLQLADQSGVKPEIAAGLGYQINPHVVLTGTVSHIFGSDNSFSWDTSSAPNYSIVKSTSALLGIKVII